jgi:hypothetical protein
VSYGLYGKGMHGYILDELELGSRVASAQSAEDIDPLGWLDDIHYAEFVEEERRRAWYYCHWIWGELINRPFDFRVTGI